MDNCSGRACRTNFYPVIGIFKSDTSLHYFINTDDITGIRYLDMDHDGALDFLSIESDFTIYDMKKLEAVNKKYKNFVPEESSCYRITVFSFRNGK